MHRMAEGMAPLIPKDKLRNDMICRLAKTEAHFKHQQRGEPDLSLEEKSNIALDILKKCPALFLERFSKYLTLEDTAYFSDQRGDYQIDFYVEEIRKRCTDVNQSVVKNRRYRALQELMDEGEYFSEDEMKWRDPLLFEQMVGQYKTEEERTDEMEQDIDRSDLRFSTILLKHMDTQANKQFYDVLKEREEEQEEEEEESDEEEEEEEDSDSEVEISPGETNSGKSPPKKDATKAADTEMSEMEKSLLRSEFLRIMQERFLSGKDTNFDYSKVDTNVDYDSLDIVGRDAEEKYFDADDDFLASGFADHSSRVRGDKNDWLLRRRMEVMELKTEEEREEVGKKGEATMDVDDYMSYVPSDDLIQECNSQIS